MNTFAVQAVYSHLYLSYMCRNVPVSPLSPYPAHYPLSVTIPPPFPLYPFLPLSLKERETTYARKTSNNTTATKAFMGDVSQ